MGNETSQGYEEAKEFITRGIDGLGEFLKYYDQNKITSKDCLSVRRLDAHLYFSSAIWNMVQDFSGRVIDDPSPEVSYQFALLTNLTKLIDVTYEMIRGGLYVGAVALIRQSFEMNARLAEIQQSHIWRDGAVPNVKHLPLGVARLYGELSDIAHFSKQAIGLISEVELVSGTKAQSICPVVNPETCLTLFDQHIASLAITCVHFLKFLENVYNPDLGTYEKWCSHAFELLQEDGVFGESDQ